jgi:hypothetical protein
MANPTSQQYFSPIVTSDCLRDMYGWLENGDYVVLHNDYTCARYFHKCIADMKSEKEVTQFLGHCKVIYIDVARNPGLLNDGEWEHYIKKAGYPECTCSLKGRVSSISDLPNLSEVELTEHQRMDTKT